MPISNKLPSSWWSPEIGLHLLLRAHITLPGHMLLYKVPLSRGPAYLGYMPLVHLGSFRGEGVCLVQLVEVVRGWRHSGLQLLPLLSGPCKL
jgi:hypothetical protein